MPPATFKVALRAPPAPNSMPRENPAIGPTSMTPGIEKAETEKAKGLCREVEINESRIVDIKLNRLGLSCHDIKIQTTFKANDALEEGLLGDQGEVVGVDQGASEIS
ncbi:hypothetical protein HG530_001438 [Fusarium avenaceum]|nr:hypothetical protein HG530_001438 [Fusarium avenaceum]